MGAQSSYSDWGNLSDTQRSMLILDTLSTTAQTVAGAIELFELVKQLRAPGIQAPQADAAAATLGAKSSAILEESKPPIVSDLDTNVGSALNKNLKKVNANPKQEHDPLIPGENDELAGPAKKFNTVGNWIRAALIVLGAAITIVMICQLAQNWDNMTVVDQILQVTQLIQQGLTVILDLAGFIVSSFFESLDIY